MRDQSRRAVAAALGQTVTAWRATKPGYAHNLHWQITLADGTTAFVKESVDEPTAAWLEQERWVYEELRPACAPAFLGWVPPTADHHALLVIEDLSACHWPPPWTPDQVAEVLRAVDALGPAPDSPRLRSMAVALTGAGGWGAVRTRLDRFDGLGVTPPEWIRAHLDTLEAAADPALLEGPDLVHLDVRSDNLCFRPDGRVALVDWNWAGRGSRAGDVAFWLNTVKLEGGPVPEAMWEAVDPGLRAIVAGYMAATASDVPLPHLPRVRAFQKAQLEVSLPWAAAGLGLPPP